MDKIKKIFNKKEGFISIVGIIMGASLFISIMWVMMDLAYYAQQNRSTKNILDNASASAVTMIDETTLGTGNIKFLRTEAKNVAMTIIRNDLFLDNNNIPLENSPLREAPFIEVYVIDDNIDKKNGTPVQIGRGNSVKTLNVKNPSIIIYAELPVKGIFLRNKGPKFTHISASQVTY